VNVIFLAYYAVMSMYAPQTDYGLFWLILLALWYYFDDVMTIMG